MPYEWIKAAPTPDSPPPVARLHLWPYRSLPRRGFVWFIGATAALLAMPLLAVIGSPVLWGLLPFLVLAIAGIWWALSRSYRDGGILEDLTIFADQITLTRQTPYRPAQRWEANPYWVTAHIHATGGPVPQYLTLRGNNREVELGAFLTESERLALLPELQTVLSSLRS